MKSTDSTNLIETVIASGAASGYVTAIPENQATASDGTISLSLGLPPECAISVAAGGKRPLMKDVNGVYRLLSAAIQSVQSWGVLPFSSDFATDIGGYPKGAICQDSSGEFLWLSTADDNTSIPGAAGASWQMLTGNRARGAWTEQYYTLPAGGSRTISLTFTAPVAGYVHVIGSANYSTQNSNQSNLTIIVNGQSLSADQVTGTTAMTNHSCVAVSAGQVTVASYCGTSSQNPPNVGHTLSYIFVPSA